MSFKNSPDITVNISDNEEELDVQINCEPCNLNFDKSEAFNLHVQSVAHVQRMLEWESHKGDVMMSKNGKSCDICCFSFSGEKSYKLHLKDAVHQRRLELIKEEHIRNEMLDEKAKQEKEACQRRIVSHLKGTLPEEDFDEFDPDSNELYCKVCDVSCYGMIPFKMHLDGVKHKKKLERSGIEGILKCDDLDKSIEELLDECREPLIGLEYVVELEYSDRDPVHEYSYLCELCDTKLITNQMIHHLTGLSHRHKYYKIHDPKAYDILWYLIPRSLKSARAREFAKKTEAKFGRKKIRHLGESPKYDFEARREREDFDLRRDRDVPRSTHPVSRPASVEQKELKRLDTKLIERAVDKFNFDRESDLEAASLTTNILVEAVLKYKIRAAEKNGNRDEELENKLKQSKKNKYLLDMSSISEPFLSQVIQEANKLAREVVAGDDILYRRATEILDNIEKRVARFDESGKQDGSSRDSKSHAC